MTVLSMLPAVFRLDQALDVGVAKDRVYALRDTGVIEAAGRGVYVQTGLVDPSQSSLAAAALRQPLATLCLSSALVHHGLSDEIPIQVDIALPRGARQPAGFKHVAWHSFATDTFVIGRNELDVAGVVVGIYSAERTIVDVFRLGYRQGTDVAHSTLRRWLGGRGNNPSSLLAIAKLFPTALPQIRHTLEILL